MDFKKVANIAIASTDRGNIFKCLMTGCDLEVDDQNDFENHLRTHLNDGLVRKFSSMCATCDAPINAICVDGELKHMMAYHANNTNNVKVVVKTEVNAVELKGAVELQKDIPTDDEESENVTHTTVEQLKPIEDIKVEPEADYDINAMFSCNSADEPSASTSQVAPEASKILASAEKSEIFENASVKRERSQSSSNHRKSSSICDKYRTSSHATKDNKSSKIESSSSKKSSCLKPSDKKQEHKESRRSDKTVEKSDKPVEKSRSRQSSSSSSKSTRKSPTKLSSSSRDKTQPAEASSHHKRSAPSSPLCENSPDKKMRLELALEAKDIESSSVSTEGTSEKIAEKIRSSVEDKESTAPVVTEESSKISSTQAPIELVSEFGTIPFKKIVGKIPKKIPVVVTESSSMPSTELTPEIKINQAIFEAPQNLAENSEAVVLPRVNASQLMPWKMGLKRTNFKYEKHFQLMTTQWTICSLFKCMDADCNFNDSNFKKFSAHLEDHVKKPSDTNFHHLCPYCEFRSSKPNILAIHIRNLHSFDRYQCSFCFFRSPEPGTVREHLSIHHNDATIAVLECYGNKIRTPEIIQSREWQQFQITARTKCKYCDSEMFKLQLRYHFENVHQIHKESELPINNPNILNCFYCRFNTLDMNEMSRHMVQHPMEARTCYSFFNQTVPGNGNYDRRKICVNMTGTIKKSTRAEEKIENFIY